MATARRAGPERRRGYRRTAVRVLTYGGGGARRAGRGGAAAMEISHLESFVVTARRGSVTLAARELGLTQSGLSRQLQRLEPQLGRALLVRTQRGVRLTAAGEDYRA